MATKIGRGIVTGRGTPLNLLLATGGKKRIEWTEQTGGCFKLKTGKPERVTGGRVQVRDPEAYDRTVYIPVSQLDGAVFLIKR